MSRKLRLGLLTIAVLSLIALAAVTQIDFNTQIKNLPVNTPQQFNFTPQSPGGSLVIGNNTITMTPVPKGVNGSDTGHYLYVSGGVGTAEACLINGGSGTSGQASGQIIINCAGTHSGAYTVQSSTTGIKEELVAAGIGGIVFVPAGSYSISNLVVDHQNSIIGAGEQATTFTPLLAGTTLITVNPASQVDGILLSGFTIDLTLQPTMNGLDISNVTHSLFHDIRVNLGANGIRFGVTAATFAKYSHFYNIRLLDQTAAGMLINGELASENFFDDFDIQKTVTGTMTVGWQENRTAAADFGSQYLRRVRVTRLAGTITNGFVFTSSVASSFFGIFMEQCVADNINGGAAMVTNNAGFVHVIHSWLYSTQPSSVGGVSITAGNTFQFLGNIEISATSGPAFVFASGPTNIQVYDNNHDTLQITALFQMPASNGPLALQYGGEFLANVPVVQSGGEAVLATATDFYPNLSSPLTVKTWSSGGVNSTLNIYDVVNKVNHPVRNANGSLQDLNSTGSAVIRTLDNTGDQTLTGYMGSGNFPFSSVPTCNGNSNFTIVGITDSTVTAAGATITVGGGTHHVLAACNATNWLVLLDLT